MERIWWDNIPIAARYVRDIVDAIREERSMVLLLPKTTPWRDALRQIVEERIASIPDRSLYVLPCPEEEPGRYLLRTSCPEERRLAYRSTKSYAEFLAKEDCVLHTRILWIEIARAVDASAWVDFIGAYQHAMERNVPRATFILALSEDCAKCRGRKGIPYRVLADEVSEYDRYAFAVLAASDGDGQRHLRVYLASLAATLCGDDIELMAVCSRRGMAFLRDPQGVLRQIAETETRSDGSPFDITGVMEELPRLIWRTQLRLVFPVIEDRRQHYIEQMRRQLVANGDVPEDIEIGPLFYRACQKTVTCTPTALAELERLKDARNKLAHLDELPFEMVDLILRHQ